MMNLYEMTVAIVSPYERLGKLCGPRVLESSESLLMNFWALFYVMLLFPCAHRYNTND